MWGFGTRWRSFDGALVRLTTPVHLEFQALGGFEQRAGLPLLSRGRFEQDGVARGDRDALELRQSTYYLEESKLAPAYGAAVESVAQLLRETIELTDGLYRRRFKLPK